MNKVARLTHGRTLPAFVILLAGSVLAYGAAALLALCIMSFFMMFSGRPLTYYWLWSFLLALPFWFTASYWMFWRILSSIAQGPAAEDAIRVRPPVTDPIPESARATSPSPRPWISAD